MILAAEYVPSLSPLQLMLVTRSSLSMLELPLFDPE